MELRHNLYLSQLAPSWYHRGLGIQLSEFHPSEDTFLSHQVWSDNIVLYAPSRAALNIMISELSTEMARHGLKWKMEDIQFLRAGPSPSEIQIPPQNNGGPSRYTT